MISTLFSIGIVLWPLWPQALHRAWHRLAAARQPCSGKPRPDPPPCPFQRAGGIDAARPGGPCRLQ